jgi:polysaccharide export outer membrane protein
LQKISHRSIGRGQNALLASRAVLMATALALCVPSFAPLDAQQLTPQQMQLLLQNPDLVRQQIQRSGLSLEQIRQQLEAAGYPPTLLDAFLAAETGAAAPQLTPQMIQALQALSVGPPEAQGLLPIPTAVGMQIADSARADTTARDTLELFGAGVFTRLGTLFQPDLGGPVPPSYRLGPGDQLVLVLTGDVELARELEVTREGFIIIPDVGQISVNNLTMDQFRTLLRQRLGRSYSGIQAGTTRFNVSVTRLRTNQVYVAGEVAQPSAYQLSSLATVLNALYAAGGLLETANFREIVVRRGGDAIATYDFYDFLLRGDTRNDIMLQSGDVVFVPTYGKRASISGAVVRPAVYDLTQGETLTDLVAAAGGFRPEAALTRISIARIVPPGQRGPDGRHRIFLDVPIEQIEGGSAPPVPIEPGDSVTVSAITDARRAVVELRGAVYDTGNYGWVQGMRLSELIRLAGGFRPAIYAGRAHIERLNPADSTRFLIPVQLPADSSQPYPTDPVLMDYDIVTVYGRDEFRSDRTVSIGGMVNDPGQYPYRAGMTLRDVILMARGLRDGAALDTAEVARLPDTRVGGTLAVTYRIPMDSSYLFDPATYPLLPGMPTQASGAPEFVLEPFDQVTILKERDWELQRTVFITGEVAFPGPRALTRKDERVSDLVYRAGGMLETSYVEGARFFRTLDSIGRVNLDLVRALDAPGGAHDLVLQPGDSLNIPEYDPTVRVIGAVNYPTSVVYRRGAQLDYYIANAGGYAGLADKANVSVRYANGSAQVRKHYLFVSRSPKPGPGSTVFVPARDPAQRRDIGPIVTSLAQIVTAAATLIIALTR